MKRHHVRRWLILSLACMITTPLIAGYFLVNDVLNSSFSIGTHDQTIAALEVGQSALKNLAKTNKDTQEVYHQQFQQIQDVKLNLADQALLRQGIMNSFTTYFVVIFFSMLMVSLGFAVFVSQRVAKAYDQSFDELLKQKERSNFLENIARWQDVAKQLAHEIKNPLQPIGAWMRNLKLAYLKNSSSIEFSELLSEAAGCVDQEIEKLQRMVESFTRFSRLPQAEFQKIELSSFINDFVKRYQDSWDVNYSVVTLVEGQSQESNILADINLLRQVLSNLLNNAVEANQGQKIDVKFSLSQTDSRIEMVVENSGNSIDPTILDKIFDPYFSTQSTNKNFGLGLAIIRKILLEHNGDIRVCECHNGAKFALNFPKAGD